MPHEILCTNCDEVLYWGFLVKSPKEIIKNLDGKCPKCTFKLSEDFSLEISPLKNITKEGGKH